VAPSLLACPGCHRLVHAEALEGLAAAAEKAKEAGDPLAALGLWRQAQALLPPGTRQHTLVTERAAALSREVEGTAVSGASGPPPGSRWARWLAPLGAVGVGVWKFKFLVALVLTKGKLLLFGLVKMPTLLSALASFGVYWTVWGWKFALGLVVSMYVHEMGHVFALSRYGIRATAPMFVPGLGAFVRSDQYPASPREDARVGLAGPRWGLYAAVAAYAVSLATGWTVWAAIARFGAWLNLLNLLPVWSLDGGRGFRSLTRGERWAAAAAAGVAWWATHEMLLAFLAIVAAARAVISEGAAEADGGALAQFIFLVAALSALCAIPIGLP
jgi:Zn-dependent protease